jgi:hypothetical protein
MPRPYRKRSAAVAVTLPMTGPHGWQVFVGDVQSGPDYETEDAARYAAKQVGGVGIRIVRPNGTKYLYYKQRGE